MYKGSLCGARLPCERGAGGYRQRDLRGEQARVGAAAAREARLEDLQRQEYAPAGRGLRRLHRHARAARRRRVLRCLALARAPLPCSQYIRMVTGKDRTRRPFAQSADSRLSGHTHLVPPTL